jgi:hypothetical protein|nr:MAG TPA: Proline/betaine transporter, CYTOPLASMIC, COILED-COIL, ANTIPARALLEL, TWO-STRANDED [Caudoviricetes sp.]
MENQEVVKQIAINCGVSMEDAATSIQKFCEVFGAIIDGIENFYELVKARIEEIKQEIAELQQTEETITLHEFIYLMNEAHRQAIEEDKKPPDSKPDTNQADSARLVGGPNI